MNLEQGQELHGFTVLTAEPLPEIDGDAYTLSHPVSGAKLLYLRNDDRNKAFSIAFSSECSSGRIPGRRRTGAS
uniref:hypothetical protein n=1 Tax=Senegalimassilia anaerobia TaxID=1473216 RepID=UPI00248E9330